MRKSIMVHVYGIWVSPNPETQTHGQAYAQNNHLNPDATYLSECVDPLLEFVRLLIGVIVAIKCLRAVMYARRHFAYLSH